MIKKHHVKGQDRGAILLYALSTCIWCRRTKSLLSEMGVAYDYIDVDNVEDEEKDHVMDEVTKWNPSASFPTLVIGDKMAICGFDEKKIREALKA